jgi:hypothetical protein
MDPTEALRRMLAMATHVLAREADNSTEAIELAEITQDLNDWLARGGFYPEQWEHPRKGGR